MRRRRPVSRKRGETQRPAERGAWLALLIVLAGISVYANSLSGVFLLDDMPRIVENPILKQPWHRGAWLQDDLLRPPVSLSLAINYALGGLNVRGYHVFNLAIHILAGLTLFGVVRRTLQSEALWASYARSATWLAFTVALVWEVHPLQTGSVTYIIQRCESMMGLFYLLTLYCAVRGASSSRHRSWYGAAIVSCTLGMTSKSVMVTAPLMILLYDRAFLARSFREALRLRWGLYLGLAASLAFLADGGLFKHVSTAFSALSKQKMILSQAPGGVSPLLYAATQSHVILHYLKLSFWPSGLCFDYWWPVVNRPAEVLPQILAIGALLVATIWALWRDPRLGFLGVWLFLILAPTSSVRPLNNAAFEHRMYLPLAAVIVATVFGGYGLVAYVSERFSPPPRWVRSFTTGIVVLVVASLGYATVRRNEAYHSQLAMWTDVVGKRPENPRAHCHIGVELNKQGKRDEAIEMYRKALQMQPDNTIAHYNLANALREQGRNDEAIRHYREAIRRRPGYAEAHINLGSALAQQDRLDEAIGEFHLALRSEQDDRRSRPLIIARAYMHLGNAQFAKGDFEEAVQAYRESLRFRPDYYRAHYNMAAALQNLSQIDRRTAESQPNRRGRRTIPRGTATPTRSRRRPQSARCAAGYPGRLKTEPPPRAAGAGRRMIRGINPWLGRRLRRGPVSAHGAACVPRSEKSDARVRGYVPRP